MLVKEWSISLIHGLGMYSSCEPMYRERDVMNDGIDAHLCGPATAILPQHESCDRRSGEAAATTSGGHEERDGGGDDSGRRRVRCTCGRRAGLRDEERWR